ncbi:MAG: hypothetical protein IJ198_13870 [Lachnospiraceae bacterium]|nr:hypothetical protein [Lachnospiraceae bacterium]
MADNKKGILQQELEEEYHAYFYNPVILVCNLALGVAGAWFYTTYIAPRFQLPTTFWAQFLAFAFFCGTVTTIGAMADGYYSGVFDANNGPKDLLIGAAAGAFLGFLLFDHNASFFYAPLAGLILFSILRCNTGFMTGCGSADFVDSFYGLGHGLSSALFLAPFAMVLMVTLLILVEGLTRAPLDQGLRKILIVASGIVMALFCLIMTIREALIPQDPEG